MSHLNPGLISAYNSLTDKHLAGYFSNTRIRRHLQRAGLITRSGRIVSDKEYRHKLIQRAHQRHVRECLAQAIFHKVLEMERVHHIEIKRKLEEFARRERVHKIKVERSKRYEEDLIRILTPRPPTGARGIRKQHSGPEGEHSESSESPGSSRPNTAPGKMQRPVRLKPIHSNSTTASLRHSSPYRLQESSNENNQPFNCTVYRESRRRFNTTEAPHGISPYCLPVINNFVTPVPPPTKRKERGLKVNPSSTLRGRRLRPTTASSGADITEDPPMLRSSVHQSKVCISMMYFGKSVHLCHDLTDMRDEVKVFQQHCGGENLCVYKGKLGEGETFQFVSKRHRGFPFSLTFFLNGLQVERLSSCCEFKHRKGSRLGGRCIIAMGLDKKPSPPPKRVREDRGREELVIIPKAVPEIERTERTGSHSELETSQPQQDRETQVKEEPAAEEDKVRDDYEEDFEADDEDPAEETRGKKSASPPPVVRKVKEASETDEDDDIKSRSGSSLSASDQEESESEAAKEEKKAEQPKEVDEKETAAPADKKDEPQPEDTSTAEVESAAPKDSDVLNSAGESTEIDISDTSAPSGNENKERDDTSGEKTVNESKQEEEQERAKSVQEKLAEAILKESQCSSEPELSDTSTDDTVESTDAEKLVKTTEQQKTVEEERTCVEDVALVVAAAVALAVLDQEETSEQKQPEEIEQEPGVNIDASKNEEVKVNEEDEKVELEEDKTSAENNRLEEKIEDIGAALLVLSTLEMDEDKTPQAQEDSTSKPTDASEKMEENEEKAAEDADIHPQETGQGAKSSEEDESSVSEPNKKTDETAVTDNAEAEAMTASEIMEMKAEPSEEREALSCEEAPVTRTETSQTADGKDGPAGSETEVAVGSGDNTDEKTADTSDDNAKEESVTDIKEEVVSAVEASKDENQEKGDLRDEKTDKSDKTEGEFEEGKEEEKQTHVDETTEGKPEESKVNDKAETEEETDEGEAKEKMENTSNEEQAEKSHSEEKGVEKVEKTDDVEDSDGVRNKDEEEEWIEKAAAAVLIANAITATDETKTETINQTENKTGQSGTTETPDHEETHEKKVVTYTTVEVKEKKEKVEEVEQQKTDADKNEENVKDSEENTETEDAVNVALAALTTAGMLNSIEAEDVAKKTEEGGNNSEKGDINAENGEIATEAESRCQEDDGEAQTKGEDDVKTAEQIENEVKSEELMEDKTTEQTRGDAEKQETTSDSAVAETEAKEEDDNMENQDQPGQNDSELQKSRTDLKEGSETNKEETKDENDNLSEPDYENRETKTSDNAEENIHEVLVVSSSDQVQPTTPTDEDSDITPLKLERSAVLSDSHTNKHSNTDDNTAAENRENGDTEEASKASEEGASVLLKPQAQSEQPLQENEGEKTEEKAAVVEETAEVLAREDLVTNWVTVHQTSKFFETFVEPLEDLKESTPEASPKEEVTPSTELQSQSVSPLQMSKTEDQVHTPKDMAESVEENKEETEVLEVTRDRPEDGELCEKDQQKDEVHVVEKTEVQGFNLGTESEQTEPAIGQEMKSEDLKEGSGALEEDKVQELTTQDNTDQADVSKTDVESIIGGDFLVTSGRPESIPENQAEEKNTHDAAETSEKLTTVEEANELLVSETEKQQEYLESSESKDRDEMLDKSQEVTQISEFTESRSDDGSQKESRHEETEPKLSDTNVNEERRDMQLIQDIKDSLSKERVSTFSVDETLFGASTYPLLAAGRTESGH
ncbi:glutamate-rich protein 3 [Xyrichtys novacula]|uniref:Glutamate-rich protein 3 n=1 Tax=Xyrichtys novacula TaxID=13765 RepID=A0AAV1FG42_XYRNO|nr:glutamate-rich protein 3 [Xyrichtys novacula]